MPRGYPGATPCPRAQARRALRPDGLFLCAILGGSTLTEMRISCAVAEQEREGGVSGRVSPLAQVRDAGSLLTRAGFALPSVDVDTLTFHYESGVVGPDVRSARVSAGGGCPPDASTPLAAGSPSAAPSPFSQRWIWCSIFAEWGRPTRS